MTKSITIYDVVLVPFPFADLTAVKKRPCLVLSIVRPKALERLLTLAMMTSHLEKRFPYDVELRNFSEAGLPKATLVRLSKLVTIEEAVIQKKLGSLLKKDQALVAKEFREALAQLLKKSS